MKQRLLVLSIFVTMAAVGSVIAFAQPPAHFPEVIKALEASPGDVQLVKLGGDVWVERLTGVAALAHLNNLRSRRPKAFANSGKTLRQRGFTPTDHVYVERTLRLASSDTSATAPGFGLAQTYSEQNASGEIVITSWTDGDDNTWEGQIYVEVYSDNDASTWEGQIDASDSNHDWVYYTKTWESPDGPLQQEVSNPFGEAPMGKAVPAVISPETERLREGYRLARQSWLEWAYCWRQSVVAWCSAGAVGCVATNGGWAGCWGATCSGVLVGSAIGCY